MAQNNFATCLAHTLEFEGGWSNHPSDPGGATMKGVIQKVYDAYRDNKGSARQSVAYISDAELRDIYKKNYWDLVHGDALPRGVDLATFDFGVNSGPARANQYRSRLGADTAVNIVKRLCASRLAFVRALGTFSVFGKGWTRRITTIEARGVRMALEADKLTPEQVREELKKEATSAATKSNQQGGGAAGTGGVATQVDLSGVDPVVGFFIFAAIVGVIAFLVYRSYTNRQRAKAYEAAAKEE